MTAAQVESLDYIVVGAGSAGSVIASRLGEDPQPPFLSLKRGRASRCPASSIASRAGSAAGVIRLDAAATRTLVFVWMVFGASQAFLHLTRGYGQGG